MRGSLALSFATAETVTFTLAGVLTVVAAMIGYRSWQRSRITPEERERRRREALVSSGKMGDANLLEIRGDLVLYSYDVRGVEYTASQDISGLKEYVPPDLSAIGPLYVKYEARNPANSIVVAEQWSGMRAIKAG